MTVYRVPIRKIATCIRTRRRGTGSLWQGGVGAFEWFAPCELEIDGIDAAAQLVLDSGIDVVSPGTHRLPLQDEPSALEYLPELHRIAVDFADRIRDGQNVATFCFEGRNRSGLLSGLILWELGMDGGHAVRTIRRRRKRDSLSTTAFADYLRSL